MFKRKRFLGVFASLTLRNIRRISALRIAGSGPWMARILGPETDIRRTDANQTANFGIMDSNLKKKWRNARNQTLILINMVTIFIICRLWNEKVGEYFWNLEIFILSIFYWSTFLFWEIDMSFKTSSYTSWDAIW